MNCEENVREDEAQSRESVALAAWPAPGYSRYAKTPHSWPTPSADGVYRRKVYVICATDMRGGAGGWGGPPGAFLL